MSGMVSDMVAIYVRRIKAGLMTLEEVPARWRDAVREALEVGAYNAFAEACKARVRASLGEE